MGILVQLGPGLQGAYCLVKEITSGQEIPQNLHGGGDISARTSLLEGEGALYHILGSGKSTEQRAWRGHELFRSGVR